ncbi:MAG: AAA family ATPase, partial [Synergistaceae bacterium]|nr:AAA family ATPase [Synergistaceae bacterium]
MIESLRIKNIGGIRESELHFTHGLNVITGESGAGKSSVVRALELLTGSRGGLKFIRAGEERGIVEARFTDKTIMREILNTGRSRAKIDGLNTGLNECASIVNSLVRIQSQFAQIELLDPERQLEMLDSCLPVRIRTEVFDSFHEIYEKARISSRELRAMKKRRSEIEKKYSNAREIFSLVKTARPEQGLEMRLENQLADLTHKITMRERAKVSLDTLTGGLSEQGLIGNIRSCFDELYTFMNDEAVRECESAIEILNDSLRDKNMLAELGDNEQDIKIREETESRLGALRKLKRICNIPDENELMNYCDEIYSSLEWLESSYKELEELSSRSLDERKKANAIAIEIRHARNESAQRLTQRVNEIL